MIFNEGDMVYTGFEYIHPKVYTIYPSRHYGYIEVANNIIPNTGVVGSIPKIFPMSKRDLILALVQYEYLFEHGDSVYYPTHYGLTKQRVHQTKYGIAVNHTSLTRTGRSSLYPCIYPATQSYYEILKELYEL